MQVTEQTINNQNSIRFHLETEGDYLFLTGPSGRKHPVPSPSQTDSSFPTALMQFYSLASQPVHGADASDLNRHATRIGDLLFNLLFSHDADRRIFDDAIASGRATPLLTIACDDDSILSLPWELLHRHNSFLVRDAQLDIVRTTAAKVQTDTHLVPPQTHFALVVNVSAPDNCGLDYEVESYRIAKTLAGQCFCLPTELGTPCDLIQTTKRHNPTGIHFSGHGGPGVLLFEDNEGGNDLVEIDSLILDMCRELPNGIPPFFYLACCHGNEPGHTSPCAAQLHRVGVTQVIAYFGPINDAFSTAAEVALYRGITEGHPTTYATRQTHAALTNASTSQDEQLVNAGNVPELHPDGLSLEINYSHILVRWFSHSHNSIRRTMDLMTSPRLDYRVRYNLQVALRSIKILKTGNGYNIGAKIKKP